MVYNKKRWQLALEAGRNVPFIGGSKVTLGSRGLEKKIRTVVMQQAKKTEEIKIRTAGFGGGTLLHDTIYTMAPLLNIAQGVQTNQRIGTQIFARTIRLSGQISNLSGQDQVSFRYLLVRTTNAYLTSTPAEAWGSGVGATDFLYNNGVPKVMELINHKLEGTKVLMDKRITVTASNGINHVNTVPFQFEHKLMHKLTYNGENLSQELTIPYNYYWVCIPHVYGGSIGSTVVGNAPAISLVSFIDA